MIKTAYPVDADPPRPVALAPAVGEHTTEILTELGYRALEIETMREQRVI